MLIQVYVSVMFYGKIKVKWKGMGHLEKTSKSRKDTDLIFITPSGKFLVGHAHQQYD